MKKLLIASAVSALFAVPATVLAQAKPKPPAAAAVPTLDKVLEASGITVNGYLDVGYSHADRDIEAGIAGSTTNAAPRVFDNQNNSFNFHQLGLTIAKQPRQGFGGLVNITAGTDAQVITSSGSAVSQFDLTQAFAQYATGPFTVIAGKFTTLHGTEVIASPSNANISRSLLFGAVPFTHTGVRGTWALNDWLSLIAGINNGWDQIVDSNREKTVELGGTLTVLKSLAITASAYNGKEAVAGGNGNRMSQNVVASYSITDALNVGGEILYVSQEIPGAAGSTTKQNYKGVAGYVGFAFTPKFKIAGRLEQFDDGDGLRFQSTAAGAPEGRKYTEVTATVAYLPAGNFEVRGEVRMDRADKDAFIKSDGGTSKSLMTVGAQALYKF